jgi:hypothetical protein
MKIAMTHRKQKAAEVNIATDAAHRSKHFIDGEE